MANPRIQLRMPQDQINLFAEEAARRLITVDALLNEILAGVASQIREQKRERARAQAAQAESKASTAEVQEDVGKGKEAVGKGKAQAEVESD